MKNSLSHALKNYLNLRRGLGFKLQQEEKVLSDFVRFLRRQGEDHITTHLAVQWATQPQGTLPSRWTVRLTMVRQFAIHLSAVDPRTEVPPVGTLPFRYRRKPPYIYSDAEIVRLIRAAGRLGSIRGMRPHTYATLFGLLAVTGLRVGEIVALDREDVDLQEGTLTVRQGKFDKSRLVPIHESTLRALCCYARMRERIYPRPVTSGFFLDEFGNRPSIWSVRWTFVKLCRQIGLRGLTDSHGPRLHDLRHSFAVRTLVGWYRDGVDVEAHLPRLSTYMGHGHVTDTYWYVTGTPELLQLAAARVETTS